MENFCTCGMVKSEEKQRNKKFLQKLEAKKEREALNEGD